MGREVWTVWTLTTHMRRGLFAGGSAHAGLHGYADDSAGSGGGGGGGSRSGSGGGWCAAAGVARLEFQAGPPSRLCYVYTMAERVCSDSPEFRPLPAMTEFINGPLRLADGKSISCNTYYRRVKGR